MSPQASFTGGGARPPPMRAVLRSRAYPQLLAAATLGRIANEMVPVGLVLYVLDETGSLLAAGAAASAFTLPSILSSALLGAWLDAAREPLRPVMADQVVAAAGLVAVIVAVETLPVAVVPVVAVAAGITAPLTTGGMTSLLPGLVPGRLLGSAYALEATSFNVAIVSGPALAAIVAAAVNPLAAVAVQIGLKLVALVLLLLGRRGSPALASRMTDGGAGIRRRVVLGFAQVLRTPALLAVTVAGALSLGGRGLLAVGFPVFAVERLGMGDAFAGALWAAFALGAIAGIAAHARARRRREERVVMGCIAASGVAMLSWPLATSPALGLALVATAGALYGPALAATLALRRRWTPDGLQGQVFTTAAGLKPGFFGLGALAGGPVVLLVGASGILLVAAAVQLLAAAVGARLLGPPAAAARTGQPVPPPVP